MLVVGMHGDACRERLRAALGGLEGVVEVDVQPARGRAVVWHTPACHESAIAWTIVSAGFGAALARDHGAIGSAAGDSRAARAATTARRKQVLRDSRASTVGEMMTPDPICVPRSMTLRELARVFRENEVSGAPVVDGSGRLVGVVSKSDLIRQCTQGLIDLPPVYLFELISGEEPEGEPEGGGLESSVSVEDIMTEDPITATRDEPASRAAAQMVERRVHRVIVVDQDRFPVGIVTSLDLLEARSGPQASGDAEAAQPGEPGG